MYIQFTNYFFDINDIAKTMAKVVSYKDETFLPSPQLLFQKRLEFS